MIDPLTHLFTQFHFRTDLFFIGQLCRAVNFSGDNKGYLHFIRQGQCLLNQTNGKTTLIERPCIVFSPSGVLHNIHPLNDEGADIFCIDFDFGKGVLNPLSYIEQELSILYLDKYPELSPVAEQIFYEQEKQECGYQAAIHHLSAYFTLQVVRLCLRKKLLARGILRGLTDKKLANVLLAIHQSPQEDWQVEKLAQLAGMSRSSFAAYFKEVLGLSPMEYLTNWRISVAQMLLQKGTPVSLVAEQVGYSHNAALTRVFVREVGQTPTEWLQQYIEGEA